MPLNFSRLYHKSDLINNNSQLFHVPGVYIWGFIYEKDGNKIGNPVNFKGVGNPVADRNKHVFIPYYVGESSSSILRRLRDEHIQPRCIPSNKRTRLSMNYMKVYFNDPYFPLHYKGNNSSSFLRLVKHYNTTRVVEYFNNDQVLALIYEAGNIQINGSVRNYPINIQSLLPGNTPINDTLDQYINSNNNFFFTYSECQEIGNLRFCESVTAIILKGKTLGQFRNLQDNEIQMILDPFYNIIDNTEFNIFKQPDQLWDKPQGPFEISNIAFPGYL